MTARGVHRSGGPGDAASMSVSVLTPSFEQAAWLPDNLRSVACQTYPDVEHVVVDGGSTDGTVGLLETASAEGRDGRAPGHRLLWVSEPDRGQAHAINKAFARSSGEIIGWINSDDAYLDCEAIARAVAVFAVRPEVDIVYGHCLQTTADGGFIQVLWAPPFDGGMLRSVNILSQPAVFIRRSALGDAMLDESFHFAMDYELWLRLEAAGRRFARLDRVLAIDRHQPGRKSSTITDVHDSDLARLAERYDTRFGPEHERVRTGFYLRQRFAGARLALGLRPPYAFSVPAHPTSGLLRRQIGSRRSSWPEEYR